MDRLCGWYGISRQAHYQMQRRQRQGEMQQAQVLSMVQALRQRHPRMGARKLLHCLQPQLLSAGIQIGRDRFLGLLARQENKRVRVIIWDHASWHKSKRLTAGLFL